MASSQDGRDHYSDIDSEFSDSHSMIINGGGNSRKSSDSNFGLSENGEGDGEFYEVPMPRTQAPEVFVSGAHTRSYPSLALANRLVSQVYISQSLSHRSKRHIRDSREYEQMPQQTRSLLEVILNDYLLFFFAFLTKLTSQVAQCILWQLKLWNF